MRGGGGWEEARGELIEADSAAAAAADDVGRYWWRRSVLQPASTVYIQLIASRRPPTRHIALTARQQLRSALSNSSSMAG